MILVDSSVWVDYFKGNQNEESQWLDQYLEKEIILVGDLILLEVLQGIKDDLQFEHLRNSLGGFRQVNLLNTGLAVQAAFYYRSFRRKGITIRKTNDCIIATWCIQNQILLLHRDRDFDPFENHYGLMVVRGQ